MTTAPAGPVACGRDTAVPVADDVVIWHDHSLHRLNVTAALVWDLCDGRPVDAIARAAADTYGVPVESVRADVGAALAELTSRGLVRDAGAPEPLPIPMVDLPVECTACGPGPAYAGSVLLAFDDGLVAVGADPEFAPALAGALAARHVGMVDGEGTSYGVVLPAPAPAGIQPVACLYRGPDLLARSRHPEVVVDAMLARLGTHARPAGSVVLDAVAVGRDDRVVLVPAPVNRVRFERDAQARGLATAPGSVTVVAGATAWVGAPWLDADRDALLRAVADRAHVGAVPAVLAPGAYRIVGLGASVPTPSRAFGELAPAERGITDLAPLLALRALAASVPLLHAADLAGISDLTAPG